jgi:UrcA family protein
MISTDGAYTIRQEVIENKLGSMPIGRISVEKRVNYADLDLSKASDVTELNERVKQAALDSCRELDHRFPASTYKPLDGPYECTVNATRQALALASAAVQSATSNKRVASLP